VTVTAAPDGDVLVEVENLVVRYPISRGIVGTLRRSPKLQVHAVEGISFALHRGEMLALVGESGCGKTTTAQTVLRLHEPDGGVIRFRGEDITRLPPRRLRALRRRMQIIYQDPYESLDPRFRVRATVEEPLVIHGLGSKEERYAEVLRALRQAGLDPPDLFLERFPHQLSGGQRQRVALARALVLEPAILLLDEPLGAIDLKLRKEMQLELKGLNKQLATTFVYVTHDQEEALTMSDRIAVMDNGRVAQLGTPAEIYENPRTAFVAKFIGESNFFDGQANGRSGAHWVVTRNGGKSFRIPDHPSLNQGREVRIAVRPEWMDVQKPDAVPPGENALVGTVKDIIYLGETMHVIVTVPGACDVTVALRNEGQLIKPLLWKRGDTVAVAWLPEDCQILDKE
jgi:spermidine/putrescine transport system ATP-binding protein